MDKAALEAAPRWPMQTKAGATGRRRGDKARHARRRGRHSHARLRLRAMDGNLELGRVGCGFVKSAG